MGAKPTTMHHYIATMAASARVRLCTVFIRLLPACAVGVYGGTVQVTNQPPSKLAETATPGVFTYSSLLLSPQQLSPFGSVGTPAVDPVPMSLEL